LQIAEKVSVYGKVIDAIDALNTIMDKGLKDGLPEALKDISAAILGGAAGEVAGSFIATTVATAGLPALASIGIGVAGAALVIWAVDADTDELMASQLGQKMTQAWDWTYDNAVAPSIKWASNEALNVAERAANSVVSWFIDIFDPSLWSTDSDTTIAQGLFVLPDFGSILSLDPAIDTLVGGNGSDIITLSSGGNTIILRDLEILIGGAGTDLIAIGDTGTTMTVGCLEILVGKAGTDIVVLDSAGTTLWLRDLETLTGGAGNDWVFIGNTGTTMSVSGLEILVGGAGTDIVTLGSAGNTLWLRDLETLTGGAGTDTIFLGNSGNILRILAGIDTIVGGTDTDIIILDESGVTLTLRDIETIVASVGTDVIMLGDIGTTMTVGAVDTLLGGAGLDVVTVTNGPGIWFQGNGGGDVVTLQTTQGIDRIAFSTFSVAGDPGGAAAYDQITNFQVGIDAIAITGPFGTSLDRNGDGRAQVTGRVTGAIDMGTDEAMSSN
jgi:hypothetical protein